MQLHNLSKYELSEEGEVYSFFRKSKNKLKGGTDKDGYVRFVLITDEGTRVYVRRASLICEAFHGPRPSSKHVVRHKDGSRTNDRRDNLEWGTQSENCQDKYRDGTAQIGTRNNNHKLNEEQIKFIKANLHIGYDELALMFKVNRTTIWCVATKRTWKHID